MIIKEFLPQEVTEDQVKQVFDKLVKEGIEPVKKNMGILIKNIKESLPFADGKMVSSIVQKNMI